ncbi:unnamed protein product, partial [Mesorhabditis belari]|uniref:STPR domain-containing protein n=1 Tax=Mesorhabditis belari TaxID=2138241 RepID=A0AAF3FK83_9BILA
MESKTNFSLIDTETSPDSSLLVGDFTQLTDQLFPKADILQITTSSAETLGDHQYAELLAKRKYEAERVAIRRSQETPEQREARLAKGREYMRRKRANLNGESTFDITQPTTSKAPSPRPTLQKAIPILRDPILSMPVIPMSPIHLSAIRLLDEQKPTTFEMSQPPTMVSPMFPSLSLMPFDIKAETNSSAASSPSAAARAKRWATETPERRLERLEKQRDYMREKRRKKYDEETPEERERRREANRIRTRCRRLNETLDEREHRLIQQRNYSNWARANQTPLEREEIRAKDQDRAKKRRASTKVIESHEEKALRVAMLRESRLESLLNETEEQRAQRLAKAKTMRMEKKARETSEERDARMQRQREYNLAVLANESAEKREQRLAYLREYQRQRIAAETPEERDQRLSVLRNYARLKNIRQGKAGSSKRRRQVRDDGDLDKEGTTDSEKSDAESFESSARSLDLDALLQLSEELATSGELQDFAQFSDLPINPYADLGHDDDQDDDQDDLIDSNHLESDSTGCHLTDIIDADHLELSSINTTLSFNSAH